MLQRDLLVCLEVVDGDRCWRQLSEAHLCVVLALDKCFGEVHLEALLIKLDIEFGQALTRLLHRHLCQSVG